MSSSLSKATYQADVDAVKSLLESGAEITFDAKQNATISHTKSEAKKKEEICRMLYNSGVSPNMTRPDGHASILELAAGGESVEILKMTLAAGADVRKGCPLHAAVEDDRLENLKVLIDANADREKGFTSDYPDELGEMLGMTPLQYAKHIGSKKCAEYLQALN